MSQEIQTIQKETLKRLTLYLEYVKKIFANNQDVISIYTLAEKIKLDAILVRDELAYITGSRRLKVNYDANFLISSLELYLGRTNVREAVLIGAGELGKALLKNKGFSKKKLSIVAAFDKGIKSTEEEIALIPLLPIASLDNIVNRLNIKIGIIACEQEDAKNAFDKLIKAGVLAVWNLTNFELTEPTEVLLENESLGSDEDISGNENLALSFAVLSDRLAAKLKASDKR